MKYIESDLVRIAKRENNTKRNYLVVNSLQGKHMPVSPTKAFEMFDSLADIIKDKYPDEKLLLIGFAETATAIGARVAIRLKTAYIQTTREIIPGAGYLYFSEEHSHATEQKLVREDIGRALETADRIIFIEDEVTTGKTILNIISVIEKEYSRPIKFAVASLLNGMTERYAAQYADRGIDLHCLVKTNHAAYGSIAGEFAGNGRYIECSSEKIIDIPVIDVPGRMDARRLVDAFAYEKACRDLWENISAYLGNISQEKVLVLGSEEFMYPALFTALKLEETGNRVKCHSTTRSPIAVSMEQNYPLHARYGLKSLYDPDRRTFIYDIESYDRVLIITDAPMEEEAGMNTLVNALLANNTNITLFRWC